MSLLVLFNPWPPQRRNFFWSSLLLSPFRSVKHGRLLVNESVSETYVNTERVTSFDHIYRVKTEKVGVTVNR